MDRDEMRRYLEQKLEEERARLKEAYDHPDAVLVPYRISRGTTILAPTFPNSPTWGKERDRG